MKNNSSYNVSTVAKDVNLEIQRLRAQVELFWEKELKVYKACGLKDGMTILELGSGPGHLTGKILETFPHCNVTSVEIDAKLVQEADLYLKKKGFINYKILHKSIEDIDLDDNQFDFAITRLVIEHLPEPFSAIKEVNRVLKSGGKNVFVDNDFELHLSTYPGIRELRELYDAYCESRIAEGGNPRIGRELPILLKKAGLKKIKFESIIVHSTLIGDQPFFDSEGIGIPAKLVNDGFLSSKAMGIIASKWRKMLKQEDHAICRQLFIACGEK